MNDTVNKRITYSYFDAKAGILEGYIDADLKIDDTTEVVNPTPSQMKAWIERKWKAAKYTGGDIETVQILYID